MVIYEILRTRRIQLGITQPQLAAYIGCHKSTISRLEWNRIEWKVKDVVTVCELLELNLTITNK